MHVPVLSAEVLRCLNPKPGKRYVDATADGGGHALEILKAIQPNGKLLAIEWDEELFEILADRLKRECPLFSKNCVLRQMSYTELTRCVRSSRFGPVAGVLFDFGLSSFHLEESKRGFSFQRNEPLDMRYSRTIGETAADVLERRSREELKLILKNFGEERFARSIAAGIVAVRRHRPIRRTTDLIEIIRRHTPAWYRRSRIHFATRTFQALRIAVNRELEHIPTGLEAACEVLAPGGRLVTITFHSLEDRAVKHFFRRQEVLGVGRPLLGKPLTPRPEEVSQNPRARSARLRAFEKAYDGELPDN